MIDLQKVSISSSPPHAPRVVAAALVITLLGGCVAPAPAPVRDGARPPRGPEAAVPAESGPMHVVRPGDTLLGISRLYGVTPKDLVAWNNLADPNQIHVGQQLRVGPPQGTSVEPIAVPQPVEIHPVGPAGETPAGVPLKQEPKGGKQPYSDEAWAALQPRPSAPATPAPATPVEPNKEASPNAVWLWPASGQIIGTFDEASNKGVDIAGRPGDPVVASAGGKVVYAGSGLRGYGKLVIIKHDANYLTAYAHNQQLLVKEGDSVDKGQKIAELGSTDADRPKLHFEIRKQGRPVDPMKYLPSR